MDYTSFAPGNKSFKPDFTLPELPPPHQPFTHKFLGTICIVVAIAGAIAYCIWLWGNQIPQSPVTVNSPSPSATADPTAGWQTYTNTEYGFQFKYPSSFSLKSLPDNCQYPSIPALECHGLQIFLSKDGLSSISFEADGVGSALVTQDAQGSTASEVDDYINGLVQQINKSTTIITNSTGVKIYKYITPNRTRYSFNQCGVDFFDSCADTSVKNHHEFDIYLYPTSPRYYLPNQTPDPNFNFYQKTTEQILSTFQFTAPVDTSSWKTYTNTQYGFSFKYPSNLKTNIPIDGDVPGVSFAFEIDLSTSSIDGGFSLEIPKDSTKTLQCDSSMLSCTTVSQLFNNNPWTLISFSEPDWGGKNTQVATITHAGNYYMFTVGGHVTNFDPVLFDQILSTFQFTK